MSAEETFSTYLKIKPINLIRAGLLNQPLLRDALYYMDIFKFKDTDIPEFKGSYEKFLKHFSNFFKLIQASKKNGISSLSNSEISGLDNSRIKEIYKESDPAFKAAFDLLNFKEVDGFNLGYSKSLQGASIGPAFKVQLIKAVIELIELDIDDPEVFCLLPFLQEGIGCDRISDMFISINYSDFLKYTERKLEEIGIVVSNSISIEEVDYRLIKPENFNGPLILIPKKLTRRLPLSFNWSDIFDCYDENSALRRRLNAVILSNYRDKSEATKKNVSTLLKNNPDLLKEIIQDFKDTTPISQLEKEVRLALESELNSVKVPSQATLKDQVLFIINQFKMYVERKGVWRIFYHRVEDEKGIKIKQPLSEDHVQRAFYLISDVLSEKYGIELIPEAETGVGPVDFKFSNARSRVLLEMKLTTHRDIRHGYVTQLEEYIISESPEYSFFVIIRLLNSDPNDMKADDNRLKRLLAIEKKHGNHKNIVVVDATPKLSASKS